MGLKIDFRLSKNVNPPCKCHSSFLSCCSQTSDRSAPFCSSLMSSSNRIFCTHDRSAVGSCNLVKYGQDLPSAFQHFDGLDGVQRRDLAKVVGLTEMCCYYILRGDICRKRFDCYYLIRN